MTLAELGKQFEGPDCRTGCDKFSLHSYLPTYERLLEPYRDTAGNVLEIGLMSGKSLLMWERYFANAKVFGMDLDDQPHGGMADLRPLIAEGTHRIMLGDAGNAETVDRLFGDTKFDVIIEDAGHDLASQLAIYENFRSRMMPEGIYIIEDVADIEATRDRFLAIDPERDVEIIDLRRVKGRFDDVLVVIR
jgi:hypothetical protein